MSLQLTSGKKKESLIRSPSPLKRSEGSSLLVKTRQSSSSPKIDERERRELLYLVIGKKRASLPCMGKGRDPLAGPLPQHLKEAESPFQLHDQKKASSVCLLVDNKREKSSWSSPFPLQEIEQSSFNRQKKRLVLPSAVNKT